MPYFDHSASTPIHPDVLKKMNTVSVSHYGNPSSTHSSGRKSKAIIEDARRHIASGIGANPSEIIFTGSGTEANNLVLWSLTQSDKKHVITSAVEHPAILRVLQKLAPYGITYSSLPVNDEGCVNNEDLQNAIQPDTGLISIMMVNNEVGSIQPIRSLLKTAQSAGISFHSDAVQALGKIPLSVNAIEADYLSFSGHKFYGPKGVGFLYKRKSVPLNSLIIGGGQESNLRAGTENVSGIAGLGEAVRLATENLSKRIHHLEKLELAFLKHLKTACPNVIFNGCPKDHIPGVISASFPGNKNYILMAKLDRIGIEVSSGSACASGSVKTSPVLEAMGISDDQNISTLRISFGRENIEEEVVNLAQTLGSITHG